MARWVQFTKRTEDPKLAWLECKLALRGIPSKRAGFSFHAPILEVPEEYEKAAQKILSYHIDNMPDNAKMFREMRGCPTEIAQRLQTAASLQEREHIARLANRLREKTPKLAKKLRKVAGRL